MYKGIVIGCGRIGALLEADHKRPAPRTHASAVVANPKTSLAAFVDTNSENLEKAHALFPDAATFTDLATCLAEVKPDIAVVATGPSSHAPIIEACARSHVPMIIGEKPIAHSMDDAQRIKRAIEKSGALFALNYQRRYFPLFADAKNRISSGAISSIQRIECRYDNGLFNNGGHEIDAVHYLLGERSVAALKCFRASISTFPPDDQNINGEVMTESGMRITLKSFDHTIAPVHELHLSGEKGSLHILEYGYAVEWKDNAGNTTYSKREAVSMTAGVLQDAIDAFEGKRSPRSGTQNGIETLATLQAISVSAAQSGARVAVEYTE